MIAGASGDCSCSAGATQMVAFPAPALTGPAGAEGACRACRAGSRLKIEPRTHFRTPDHMPRVAGLDARLGTAAPCLTTGAPCRPARVVRSGRTARTSSRHARASRRWRASEVVDREACVA